MNKTFWIATIFLLFAPGAPARAALPQPQPSPAGVPAGEDDDENFRIDGEEALPNFHQVSTGVYRLGQPNAEGLKLLAAMGVRTILSVREKVDPEEAREAERLGMKVESVPMSGLFTPKFSQIDAALAVISDFTRRPVAVHCRFGKDRTGYSIAAWRVTKDSASPGAAALEARRFGCCLPTWKDLKTFLIEYSGRRPNQP